MTIPPVTAPEETALLDADVWQQQLDELVALSSILDQDFRLLSTGGVCTSEDADSEDEEQHCTIAPEELYACGPPSQPGLFSCELTVHVDTVLPDGLRLVVSDASSSAADNGNGSSSTPAPDSMLQHLSVKHLPPICLQITFPAEYPAQQPPMLQLRAMWLRPSQAAHLKGVLLSQWQEHVGEPICYEWTEWLKNNALQELGILDTGILSLGPPTHDVQASRSKQKAAEQPQQHSCSLCVQSPSQNGHTTDTDAETCQMHDHQQEIRPDQLAISLVRYSIQHAHYLFQFQTVNCPVCFEDKLGKNCMLLDCGHSSCMDCFRQFAQTQVHEGAVEGIRCMEPSCRAPIHASTIKSVLSPEEYERWERLLLQRTLDKMEDVVYCPRCNTSSLEDQDHCAQCPKCFFVFCGLCDEAWHPGSKCLTPDQALERKRDRLERSGNMSQEDRQRRQQDLIGQYKSVALVYSTSKQCPACQMAIQKTEGCNKMTCTFCNTKFCFRCLRVIDDYNHFGEGKCDLFDVEEVNRWNAAQMDLFGDRYYHVAAAGFVVREARRQNPGREGNRPRFASCPTCGQYNMKDSRNNLLRCYACNSYFCFQCRAVLRSKPGQHFGLGPNKCKQHSDD